MGERAPSVSSRDVDWSVLDPEHYSPIDPAEVQPGDLCYTGENGESVFYTDRKVEDHAS